MNKACLVLMAVWCPATLFAGDTMVTRTEVKAVTGPCNFRVDKCETSVVMTPTVHYTDGTVTAAATTGAATGDPVHYSASFIFADYHAVHPPAIDDLVAIIRSKLSNCPEVTVSYDEDSGNLTIHYLIANGGCDCDWVVNVRNVTADDFVLKRTSDNYSPYLGQMERQKFHCTTDANARDIQSACAQICKLNSWTMFN